MEFLREIFMTFDDYVLYILWLKMMLFKLYSFCFYKNVIEYIKS